MKKLKTQYSKQWLSATTILLLLLLFQTKVNAQIWSNVATGTNGCINALAVYNNELYAAGDFSLAGNIPANNIARWNGAGWSAVGAGTNNPVYSLVVYNGELYVNGEFDTVDTNPINHIAKWNGSWWSGVGTDTIYGTTLYGTWPMAVYNGFLYVGSQGGSTFTGSNATNIAKWDGVTWSAGTTDGVTDPIYSLGVFNNELYAGTPTMFVPTAPDLVLKLTGNAWSGTGSLIYGEVHALHEYNSELYVAGFIQAPDGYEIVKWNGSNWSGLNQGIIDTTMSLPAVSALTEYNGELYVGGSFSSAGNLPPSNNIAKWDGTNWSALGSGIGGTNHYVKALCIYNNELYVGGCFNAAGGINTDNIAKWTMVTGINDDATGIQNNSSVHPNPLTTQATISLSSEVKNGLLTIYDLYGKEVKNINFSGKQVVVERENLENGIYFYQIISEEKINSKGKFILGI